MADIAGLLHTQIQAVCPIDGVSIGDPADKTTWIVQYDSIATTDQQAAAQGIVTAFDITWPDNINSTQALLDESDLVATRCFKAAVTFPAEWQTYVTTLRAIVKTGQGAIPNKPSYPAGT